MKQNIYYTRCLYCLFTLVLVTASSLFTSCDKDFLEITPEDRINRDQFYANDEELLIGVNGVYALQRQLFSSFLTGLMHDGRSDDVSFSVGNNNNLIDVFEEPSNDQTLLGRWLGLYEVINHANLVIINAPEATGNQELIDRVVGEAKFLRAQAYFDMTLFWGGVPLRLDRPDFENIVVPTSSVDDVYNQIVSDLTDATNVLPESYDGSTGNEIGRVTSLAAWTLLGKVELQRGNNSATSTALSNVIDKASLLTDYSDIFAPANDNHSESIYEIGFNPSNNHGNGLPSFYVPLSETQRLNINEAGNASEILPAQVSSSLINSYESGDLRATSSFSISVDDNVPYVSKYLDPSAAGSGHDVNLILLRYADVLLMKAEADGESAGSYELINQVRRRGYGLDPSTPDALVDIDASSPGTFLEKVLNERRSEFAFEFHRWRDLLRIEGTNTTVVMEQALLNDLGITIDVDDTDLLYAVPASEVAVSGGLVTQNPGKD